MFDYETVPLHWINRLGFLTRKKLAKAFRAAGQSISPEEWAILLVLWKYGAKTPSDIADGTFKDRTTVTRLLDGLVSKGFVERKEDPEDRRRSLVLVSSRGNALRGELLPIAQALIEETTAGLTAEELEVTTRTLKKMNANLVASDI